MTDRELERRLNTALEHAAPNDLEGVLSRCKSQNGTVVPFERPKKRPGRRAAPWLAAACLALVLVGGGLGIHQYRQASTVASVISLDVNPSVELDVNSRERVIAAVPLNADANEILDGMDLKGTDLNTAINAIMGSLLKNGYVDELANSILISVEDDDAARGEALEEKLTTEIEQVLASAQVNGAILSQTLSGSSTLQQKADEYGISLGKATLIQSLVDGSSHLTFESLVGLSINELNLLVNSTAVQEESGGQSTGETNSSLHSVGTASQSGYIGVEAAKEAALNHAGVTAADAVFLEADYDYEDGRMVYEIEFAAGNTKYEYDVDASTGEVVKYEREGGQTAGTGTGSAAAQGDVGEAAARAAALNHAGVTEADTSGLTVKRDYDDGRLTYEIDFWAGNAEYEYVISAADGTVLKSKREEHPGAISAGQSIGRDAARDAALNHAGVSLNDAYELEVEEDFDERTPFYKVEFKAGGMEYEYEIDAQSGAILTYEADYD
ncbi:MAG TPA: PepSY domain-containing protein [Candidatus Flavonifractor avicola]|nr:PepSY domain-containing protein [Candidatus Flavonifractor avicola]